MSVLQAMIFENSILVVNRKLFSIICGSLFPAQIHEAIGTLRSRKFTGNPSHFESGHPLQVPRAGGDWIWHFRLVFRCSLPLGFQFA
jgi:hypothetical protein